jgi:hypothetical protein
VFPKFRTPRETAEARFDRTQKTATSLTEATRDAVRVKIARLRALRTAKEEAEREAKEGAADASPRKRLRSR